MCLCCICTVCCAVVCTVSELLRYICTAVVYTVSELYDVSVLYACCYLYCICTVTKALHVRSRRQLISYSQKWLTTSYFKAPPLYDGQKEKLLINLFIYLCTRSLLPRRKDCLQRFVVVLTEQKALKELCQFPYAGLEDEVCVRQLPWCHPYKVFKDRGCVMPYKGTSHLGYQKLLFFNMQWYCTPFFMLKCGRKSVVCSHKCLGWPLLRVGIACDDQKAVP